EPVGPEGQLLQAGYVRRTQQRAETALPRVIARQGQLAQPGQSWPSRHRRQVCRLDNGVLPITAGPASAAVAPRFGQVEFCQRSQGGGTEQSADALVANGIPRYAQRRQVAQVRGGNELAKTLTTQVALADVQSAEGRQ